MSQLVKENALVQIEKIETLFLQLINSNSTGQANPAQFIMLCESVIVRIAGVNSIYMKKAQEFRNLYQNLYANAEGMFGVIKALKFDVQNDYLIDFEQLINADTFSDFPEMAEHLLEENYKDPAAVIIGSVLEEHVRKLCTKTGISVEAPDSKEISRPKRADTLNSELASANVYNKLDQKNTTAWLDLRNKAAHGKYTEYTKEQVAILLQSVRDFITRHPA